jgi:hypothetical protein
VEIFTIEKLQYIDLSVNQMSKLGLMIGKKMRDEVNHIKWIDLTQNDFYNDNTANSTIIAGLKKQSHLVHAGLSVKGIYSDQLVRLL